MSPKLLTTTLALLSILLTINLSGQNNKNAVLQDIENRIESACAIDIKNGSLTELPLIEKELKELQEKRENFIISYWLAYLKFNNFIYYNTLASDKATISKTLQSGIDELNKIKTKSSDDYALLARLQICLIPYIGSKKMKIIQDVNTNLEKSLLLDPNNLRANLINGQYDLYTPITSGGGEMAEAYLLKCLSLPDQTVENNNLPSWGRCETYYYLVIYYTQKEDKEKALKYYKEGIKKYPSNAMLQKLDVK